MAESTTGTLVKVGLFAGAAFLAYKWFWPVDGAVAPSGTAQPPNTPAGPAPDSKPPVSGYNTASALFQRITDAAKAANMTGTASPDQWNVLYAGQGGPGPAPDPVGLFGSHDPVTLAQYWAVMSAWLAKEKGLTGFGRYAALGRLVYLNQRVIRRAS